MMLKVSLVVLVIGIFFASAHGQIVLSQGYVQTNFTVVTAGETNGLLLQYHLGNVDYASLNFSLYPCFGKVNWYLARGYYPNSTNNTCEQLWPGDTVSRTSCNRIDPAPNGDYYITVEGISTYDTKPVSAIFDFLVLSSSDTSYSNLVPVPGASGKIDTVIKRSGDFTLKWTGTGNTEDNYHIYYKKDIVSSSDGWLVNSACGVTTAMDFVATVSGTSSSDNSYSYSDQIDSQGEYTYSVVVERPGGYKAAYKTQLVNDSSALTASFALIMLIVLALF